MIALLLLTAKFTGLLPQNWYLEYVFRRIHQILEDRALQTPKHRQSSSPRLSPEIHIYVGKHLTTQFRSFASLWWTKKLQVRYVTKRTDFKIRFLEETIEPTSTSYSNLIVFKARPVSVEYICIPSYVIIGT